MINYDYKVYLIMKSLTSRAGRAILLLLVLFLFFSLLLVSCGGAEEVYRGEGILTVHYLDVGQSDCTFVEVGGEYTLMIDASDEEHSSRIVRYVKELGYDSIDLLVLTHPHSDHIGGAPAVIDALSPELVYMTEQAGTGQEYANLVRALSESSSSTETVKKDVSFTLGAMTGRFLAPFGVKHKDENDNGAVLRLDFGSRSFLFMGDAGNTVEQALVLCGTALDCDVVKAGHHGSDSSSCAECVSATGAGYVVFSCSEDIGYGHPSPYALDRWERSGAVSFCTGRDSDVIAYTDGERLCAGGASDAELGQSRNNIYEGTDTSAKADIARSPYLLDHKLHEIHISYCTQLRGADRTSLERSSADITRLRAEGYEECEYCFK